METTALAKTVPGMNGFCHSILYAHKEHTANFEVCHPCMPNAQKRLVTKTSEGCSCEHTGWNGRSWSPGGRAG